MLQFCSASSPSLLLILQPKAKWPKHRRMIRKGELFKSFKKTKRHKHHNMTHRMLLMLTDPKKRTLALTRAHATYLETVPFRVVAGENDLHVLQGVPGRNVF
jgi:hypothetical protein